MKLCYCEFTMQRGNIIKEGFDQCICIRCGVKQWLGGEINKAMRHYPNLWVYTLNLMV